MFSKNKKKQDTKIRWQNPRFRDSLKQARGYKRQAKNIPQTSWAVFLSKVGLGSWVSRFATLLVFLFLIYLVFIPNFFFIKHINITGGDLAARSSVQDLTASFLDKAFPLPQKNLLLLSQSSLKNYLLAEDQKVLSIDSITKQLPSTINISITPRLDKFLIETASSTYFSVANDGLVTQELFPDASNTLPSLAFLIKLDNANGLFVGQPGFSGPEVAFLQQLQNQLPSIIKSPINYYQIPDLQTPDLSVYLKNGLKVLFDLNSDPNKSLGQLKLLFAQFSSADISKLFYVDMRFDGRSYVCDKGAACVKDLSLPNDSASSTQDNLSN